MARTTKFSWRYYTEPTPRRMRVLGDSILAASGVISTGGLVSSVLTLQNPTPEMIESIIRPAIELSLWATILGFIGKFLTTFFKEEEETYKHLRKEKQVIINEDKPEDNADQP